MANSLETIRSALLTTVFGRRLGLSPAEFLGGAKDIQVQVQDLNTGSSAIAVPPYGISRITCSGSTQGPVQYLLDAPVPGVYKTLMLGGTAGATSTGSYQFLSTAAGAAILISSLGSTSGVVNLKDAGAMVKLVGLTTNLWGVVAEALYTSTGLAKAVTFTTSTA
mgnify:CR=1 FL=1